MPIVFVQQSGCEIVLMTYPAGMKYYTRPRWDKKMAVCKKSEAIIGRRKRNLMQVKMRLHRGDFRMMVFSRG